MKKILLLSITVFSFLYVFSQTRNCFPTGFKTATIPAIYKNIGTKVSIYPTKKGIILSPESSDLNSINLKSNTSTIYDESLIGNTFYDLQTNNSINNCLYNNFDGTISAAWTFSPNAIQTTNPPYPSRESGYNYFDGNNWGVPSLSPTYIRTGFPNIVVTPSGKEILIAHTPVDSTAANQLDSNKIIVMWRSVKGSLNWDTIMYPWGNHVFHTLPKACGGVTNENVYVIFQGSLDTSISMTPPHTIEGQNGPLYFSKSLNGGISWSPAVIIPEIDATHYRGFNGDSYNIDATGDTVAISFGDIFTDVGLLKSTDAGLTWTKYIIQQHPQPFYNPITDSLTDINNDGIADTISSNGSDSKVLIDHNGLCHVWFSSLRYINDIVGDGVYTAFYGSDSLFYWNENMNQLNGYVTIASAQDFNGNGVLDVPNDSFPNCIHVLPWGQYGGGITQMPSAGIDNAGTLYLSYQTINENTDTTFYHEVHRHIYMMTLAPPYNPFTWTLPYDIVPSIADGGDGENQEAVFGCTARNVAGGYAYVLYQRDNAPGYGLAPNGTCDMVRNLGNSSDIVVCKQDISLLNIPNTIKDITAENIFVGQNYPNPSSLSTEIKIRLNKAMNVTLEIHDMIGKAIYSKTDLDLSSGTHTLQLNTSEFKKGVYTYSVIAGGQKITKQMMVY